MATRIVNTINKAVDLAAKQSWQFINPDDTNPTWTHQPPTIDNNHIHFVMRSPILTELDERFELEPAEWLGYVSKRQLLHKAHKEDVTVENSNSHTLLPTETACMRHGACSELAAHFTEIEISLSDGTLDGPITETGDGHRVRLKDLVGKVEDLRHATSIEAIPAAVAHKNLIREETAARVRVIEARQRLEAAQNGFLAAEREHTEIAARLTESRNGTTTR